MEISIIMKKHKKYEQLLRIKSKSHLDDLGEEINNKIYKALEDDPAKWQAALEADISKQEEAIRREIVKRIKDISVYYILSPYSRCGYDYDVITERGVL